MKNRKRLLALLLSVCVLLSVMPLMTFAANTDWTTIGIFKEDFEDSANVNFSLDTSRTVEAMLGSADLSAIGSVPSTTTGNTSASAYKIKSNVGLWTKPDGFKYSGKVPVFTPDIWTAATENNMSVKSAKVDAVIAGGNDGGIVIIYSYAAANDWKAFEVGVNSGNLLVRNYQITPEIAATADGATELKGTMSEVVRASDGKSGFSNTDWTNLEIFFEESGNVILKAKASTMTAPITANSSYDLDSDDESFFAVSAFPNHDRWIDNVAIYFSAKAIADEFTAKYADLVAYGKGTTALPEDTTAITEKLALAESEYQQLHSDVTAELTDTRTAFDDLATVIKYTPIYDAKYYADDFEDGASDFAVIYPWKDANSTVGVIDTPKANGVNAATENKVFKGANTTNFAESSAGKVLTYSLPNTFWNGAKAKDLSLKHITFDMYLSNSASGGQFVIYDYTDEQNWKALLFFTDTDPNTLVYGLGMRNYIVVDGTMYWNKLNNGDNHILPGNGGTATYVLTDVITETTWVRVDLDYTDDGNVKFIVTTASGKQYINDTLTVSSNTGPVVNPFVGFSAYNTYTYHIDNIEMSFDRDVFTSNFVADHKTVIDVGNDIDSYDANVLKEYQDELNAFYWEYSTLPDSAKASENVVAAKAAADKINAVLVYTPKFVDGVYTENFETGTTLTPVNNWSTEQPATIEDNPYQNGFNNTATKVAKIDTLQTWEESFNQGKFSVWSFDDAMWDIAESNNYSIKKVSFDMPITVSESYLQFFVYYYNNENDWAGHGVHFNNSLSSEIGGRNYIVSPDGEGGRTIDSKYANKIGLQGAGANEWLHFDVYYLADGTVKFVGSSVAGEVYNYTTYYNIEEGDKPFVGFTAGAAANIYVDNIQVTFAADSSLDEKLAEEYAFVTDYEVIDVAKMDANRIAPYDITAINSVIAKYNALSDEAKALADVTAVYAKIDAVKEAAKVWDITNDETIAASYKALYADNLTDDAYSVYNRLTASQKALLKEEYASLLTYLGTLTADTTIDVECVGDSITAGNGADSANSYPNLLASKLGDGYTVENWGIAGYRVLNATDLTNDKSTALQYRTASREWYESHDDADIVILMMGTNDMLNVKNHSATEQFKVAYEALIQSYLAADSAPTVLIATTPARWDSTGNWETATEAQRTEVAKLQIEIAEKYGLAVIDMYQITNNWSDWADMYADKLHPNASGYDRVSTAFADFITGGSAVVNTDNTYILDLSAQVNAQYAPEMISATITRDEGKQNIRFKSQFGYVKSGAEVAEYGMICTYYGNITNGTVSYDDLVLGSTNENVKIASTTATDSVKLDGLYYATVGRIPQANYGNRIIARSYIKYTDGTVYYSCNSTDGGSIANATGTENGYASRSVISIAKTIATWVWNNKDNENMGDFVADIDTIISGIEEGNIIWQEAAKENNGLPILTWLCDNASDIDAAIKLIGQ